MAALALAIPQDRARGGLLGHSLRNRAGRLSGTQAPWCHTAYAGRTT